MTLEIGSQAIKEMIQPSKANGESGLLASQQVMTKSRSTELVSAGNGNTTDVPVPNLELTGALEGKTTKTPVDLRSAAENAEPSELSKALYITEDVVRDFFAYGAMGAYVSKSPWGAMIGAGYGVGMGIVDGMKDIEAARARNMIREIEKAKQEYERTHVKQS